MAFNETGHYKNVAHLDLLIGYATSYGTIYKPSKDTIKLPALQLLYQTGHQHIIGVQDAKNQYVQRVTERETAFSDIKRLVTRIVANLYGTNVSLQTIEDVKIISNKIKAFRPSRSKGNAVDPNNVNPTAANHSASRQSHDSLYENFHDLVQMLRIAEGYDPVADEFQLEQLAAYASSLKAANENVNAAVVAVVNSRLERDHFLYAPGTGLVDIALDAKQYIKGIFGAASPEFKIINRIKFRNNE